MNLSLILLINSILIKFNTYIVVIADIPTDSIDIAAIIMGIDKVMGFITNYSSIFISHLVKNCYNLQNLFFINYLTFTNSFIINSHSIVTIHTNHKKVTNYINHKTIMVNSYLINIKEQNYSTLHTFYSYSYQIYYTLIDYTTFQFN
jgi:hypothetical protein